MGNILLKIFNKTSNNRGMPSKFPFSTEGVAPTLWYAQRYNLDENLEEIAPTTDFTCTENLLGFPLRKFNKEKKCLSNNTSSVEFIFLAFEDSNNLG